MSDKAVIYCRVSSTKQRIEGDGLASQEVRCREYARMKGYDVATDDDGKSFYVLDIKVRKKIVADGIDDPSFDMAN